MPIETPFSNAQANILRACEHIADGLEVDALESLRRAIHILSAAGYEPIEAWAEHMFTLTPREISAPHAAAMRALVTKISDTQHLTPEAADIFKHFLPRHFRAEMDAEMACSMRYLGLPENGHADCHHGQ